MPLMLAPLRRMIPDDAVARSLAVQSVLYALGDGVFMTGNAVYFTQIVGLTAAQVGLGLSITGVVALALSVPLGKVADRYGARRMWAVGAALLHPAVRAAERFLTTHALDPSAATA